MGDLNCDLLDPENHSTKTLRMILELGNIDFRPEFTLTPTRITNTSAKCIDFIAVDRSLSIGGYMVSDLLLSDHHPVEMELEIGDADFNKILPVRRRSFKDIDFNAMGERIGAIQLSHVDDSLQLDNQVQLWNDNFLEVLDDFAPIRSYPRCFQK